MAKTKIIIDSQLTTSEAIVSDPHKPCPPEILQSLGLMEVEYIGFDGHMHKGQIVVSIEVMAEVESFFKNALEISFPISKVVPLSHPEYRWNGVKVLADNVSASFDYREIKNTDKLSLHAHGLAIDINPVQNPYILYKNGHKTVYPKKARWEPDKPGTLSAEHPLVKLMEGFGWEWGGHWKKESGRTDYQHFQKSP
jgi:hypothetical protein